MSDTDRTSARDAAASTHFRKLEYELIERMTDPDYVCVKPEKRYPDWVYEGIDEMSVEELRAVARKWAERGFDTLGHI